MSFFLFTLPHIFFFSFSLLFTYFCNIWFVIELTTGSPSSKYKHQRTSALLHNIRNIRICIGKKPIVSVTYENERISIKNSLPYIKCVLRLSCVAHGSIYGRFIRRTQREYGSNHLNIALLNVFSIKTVDIGIFLSPKSFLSVRIS